MMHNSCQLPSFFLHLAVDAEFSAHACTSSCLLQLRSAAVSSAGSQATCETGDKTQDNEYGCRATGRMQNKPSGKIQLC